MKQVLVFPRGQLNGRDKERLTKAGIVAVEADDPSKVVTLLPNAPILTGDDMLMAAFAGVLADGYSTRPELMIKELHRRAKARETERTTTAAPGNSPDTPPLK